MYRTYIIAWKNNKGFAAMKEYKVYDDVYLRYHDFDGDKEAIVFIHGLGCASSYEYPQVIHDKDLSRHRCILIDLLGSGYSDKPNGFDYSVSSHAIYLKQFIKDLELKSFILFGHSMGGAVAIELASMCKEVSRLILSESNLEPSKEGATSYKISSFTEELFIKEGFYKIINKARKSGNIRWAATLSNSGPEAMYKISKSARETEKPYWQEMLLKLNIPRSFIFGEKSIKDDKWEDKIELFEEEGLHIEIVKDAGHSMALDNPKGLAKAILGSIC